MSNFPQSEHVSWSYEPKRDKNAASVYYLHMVLRGFTYKNSLKFSQTPKQLYCNLLRESFQMTYDTWLSELYDVFDILQ